MRGSFQEFLGTMRVQNALRSQGFRPLGWSHGYLVWGKGGNGSICDVRDDISREDIIPVDHINAIFANSR